MFSFKFLYRILLILFFAIGGSYRYSFSQSDTYKWYNPAKSDFPVIDGRGWQQGLAYRYDRLPAKAENTVRKAVWSLSQQSAGLMIRFRTNAGNIRVRYMVSGKLNMPHMASTGVSGVDLYALDKDGGWQWSGGKYSFGDTIEYHFSSLNHDYTREYHLYLPVHNQIKWLEIGVPDQAEMTLLPVSPDKPVVLYGTSIMHGTAASRPGMTWAAILGRRLHTPVINLGFSGNGKLEVPVIKLLSELDAKIYVLDCFPNLTGSSPDTVKARLVHAVNLLQKSHPKVPILITEDADAGIKSLDGRRNAAFDKVNKAAQSAFKEMKARGVRNIYLLTSDQIGLDEQSTVEGVHPNDYGMMQYALAYEEKIRSILNEPTGDYSTTKPCIQYRSKVYDWRARHRKELELNRISPPRIIFLGNSITHYWGGEPTSTIHRGDDSWNEYFKPYGVRNLGFSWDRIENVLWRVYHGELDGYDAKQVLINIGTNNLAYNSDSEIIAGLKLLVDAVKTRQPGASVLMIGIYPRKGGEERVKLLNKKIVQLCGEENIDFINPGTKLLDQSGKVVASLFQDGRLHPNADGYRILAKAIEPHLIQ